MHSRHLLVPLLVLISSSVGAQGPAPAGQRPPEGRPATPAVQPSAPTAAGALPVRRVVLYKTGVGYFEHLGNVRNRQDVAIRFTSAQLNDVLKSLTTIDMGNGQVTGISYNSIAPMEQRLGALRIPIGPGATTVDLLAALRGARIEASGSAGTAVGRLLSVERQNHARNGESVIEDVVSLVTDTGDVRSFTLTPFLHIRIVDRDLRDEVSRYLDVVGSAREQDVRQMVISTSGSGERPLFVSYVSEVPIWKTTYRLVLREQGAKPLLQGWAIIDNTIGEDWTGVELSLVAGSPQSFIQNISQPYMGAGPRCRCRRRQCSPRKRMKGRWSKREHSTMSGAVASNVGFPEARSAGWSAGSPRLHHHRQHRRRTRRCSARCGCRPTSRWPGRARRRPRRRSATFSITASRSR